MALILECWNDPYLKVIVYFMMLYTGMFSLGVLFSSR